MKALIVARKTLLEVLREWQLLALTLLLPLVFVGLAAATYTGSILVQQDVWVIAAVPEAEPLLGALEAARFPDGRPRLDIHRVDEFDAALEALEAHTADALLVVEPAPGQTPPIAVTVYGDALYSRFYHASIALDNRLEAYAAQVIRAPVPVDVRRDSLYAAGPQTEFDLYAPGMMVFAILMIVPQTAMLVARETRQKTLDRLRISRLSAASLLSGISLSQLVIALVQVVLVFAAAMLLGFHNQGSLFQALLAGMVLALGSIGMGLLTACFVENDSQAANIGSTVAMLQVFLSGSFYVLPPITVFTVFGHQVDIFDIFPATHGFMALQSTLSYGATLNQIGFRLVFMALLSLLYFAAGIWLFHRMKIRPADC